MKNLLCLVSLLMSLSAFGYYPNRFTTNADGTLLNGNVFTNISVTIKVFTNGTAVGPNGSISTVGTITCGLQEAINALPVSFTNNMPGGGKIELQTGAYYISTNLYVSNFFGHGLTIQGAGMNVSGITYVGSRIQGVLRVVDDQTDRSSVYLRDLWLASNTNATTNIVFVSTYGRINLDHCWIGSWEAMTNNQVFGSSRGLTTATQGTFNTTHRPNLVGLDLAGSGDQVIINGCNFLSLACGINTIADHTLISGCEFSYIGATGTNNWTTNSWQYSLKPAISVPATVSGLISQNNFFYSCEACYFLGSSINNGTVLTVGDQYENCVKGFLISPNSRVVQYAFDTGSSTPPDSLVSTLPYALISGIEPYRVMRLNLMPNITELVNRSNSSQAIWSGGMDFGAGSLTYNKGTLTSFRCVDSPTNGINVTFTSVASYAGVGTSVYTNTTTGFYVLYDPALSVNNSDQVEIYDSGRTEVYGFSSPEEGEDGILWQFNANSPLAGTGNPVLFAQYTNPSLTAYLDGSGATNLNASSLASGTVPVARLPVTSTNAAPCFTVTNPIVSGVRWTNNTGTIGLLSVNYTLNDSSISGDPGLCMTNTTVGEWFNATNNFVLTVNIPGRATFRMGTNEVFICTNKSSGSATATLDGSWFRP